MWVRTPTILAMLIYIDDADNDDVSVGLGAGTSHGTSGVGCGAHAEELHLLTHALLERLRNY